jgi:hypothetical protein
LKWLADGQVKIAAMFGENRQSVGRARILSAANIAFNVLHSTTFRVSRHCG